MEIEKPITDIEAAPLVGLSVQTLRRDRCKARRGYNIPYIKLGNQIRYLPSQLQAWMQARIVNPVIQQQADVPPQPVPLPQPKPAGVRGRGRPRKMQG